ncbi:S-adenosyl-L-methionine-dependent methyltransferase [Xylaria telfairii]|nr:S-adenosyl-L-methionine-dependent methyltransferase [Xylaria telfairii]
MAKPAHLEPSKLGTKEYWDALYTTEIANHAHDPTDTGTAWFDDSDASTKLVEFLEDNAQDLSLDESTTSFLDLGTGNGALLFALRDAGWRGPMLGVDYSAQSVRFARRIERARRRQEEEGNSGSNDRIEKEEDTHEAEVDIHFAEHDILHGAATTLLDVARFPPAVADGWDVVLDKGTFDAISLSSETLDDGRRRVSEAYGARVLPLVREGGLFLVTSCNWTEAELRSWFADEGSGAVQEIPVPVPPTAEEPDFCTFEIAGRVEYRSFSFGGVKGQTISTLCFRKIRKSR